MGLVDAESDSAFHNEHGVDFGDAVIERGHHPVQQRQAAQNTRQFRRFNRQAFGVFVCARRAERFNGTSCEGTGRVPRAKGAVCQC